MTAESKLARWARSARELPRRVPPKPRSAAIAGLIAVLAGASLAVAPVTVFDTRVDWPARDATTDSTVLLLTNQTPYSLDLRFDSAAVTAAEGDVLFATMEPSRGDARELGLVIDVDSTGSTITVETAGQTADLSAADSASWQLIADSSGTRIQADGAEVASWPSVPPPQIDALITSAIGLSAADLSANLQVVDDPASQPTIVKIALMIVMWTALLIALFTLRRDDRSTLGPESESESASTEKTTGSARRRFRIILVITDVLVVTAMTAWIFIGPMTDDDGYYAHMADNYLQAGYVGNYYQLFNQPFTPFTWFWQFLGIWQAIGGSSPVWLRVPSLIACLIAWFICRTLLARLLAGRDARLIAAARLTLAVFFVAWWSAFTIGSRPEGVGALGFAIALALTLRSIRTSTLLPAAFAALAAGLAFAAHPTGAVAFAPVILGIPHFWRVARRGGASLATAVCRTTATLSVGSVALFAAFADASLHDMQLNSARFAAVEKPQDWRDEWNRYNFLFSADPMGSYAKRAVVLIALVALVWFVIAWVTHRFAGRTRAPRAFTWIGWSLLLGFLALWITTSKWTHHFGALSTVGPLLIAVVLFYGPVLVADILKTERLPIWVPVVAAVSFVPPIIVAMRGPNLWAYAWNQFMYRSGLTPGIGPLPLGATAMWGAITVVAIAVGLLVARRRARPHLALFAPAAMVLIMGVLSTGFLYGSFGLAAVKTNGRYSPGASNIADPFGTQCRVEDAITLWDAADSAPLDPVFSTSAVDGATDIASPFRPGAVLIDNGAFVDGVARAEDAPPAGVGDVVSTSPADATAGAATSSWFALPAELAGGQRIVASVGGDAGPESTNGLIVQVGRLSAGVVTIERESWLTDSAERPGWRTLQLPVIADDLGSNGVIRLIGVDGSALPGAWFGFSGPSLSNGATMRSVVGDAPSVVAWQSTFWFPCARPAVIASGIIEPPAYSTTFGDGAPDNIWVDRRGGILAGAARIATVNTPASDMDVVGYSWGRVQLFDYPFRTDGYTLERTPVTTLGIGNPFGQPSQLIDWSARR